MKRPGFIAAGFATLCLAGMATMLSWPEFHDGTWQTASPPSWWQLGWLWAIGLVLSVLPSFLLYSLGETLGISETTRYVLVAFVMLLEISTLAFLVFLLEKWVWRFVHSAKDTREVAAATGTKSKSD